MDSRGLIVLMGHYVDRTHLVLACGKLVQQKRSINPVYHYLGYCNIDYSESASTTNDPFQLGATTGSGGLVVSIYRGLMLQVTFSCKCPLVLLIPAFTGMLCCINQIINGNISFENDSCDATSTDKCDYCKKTCI